jgi:hypothetical protein
MIPPKRSFQITLRSNRIVGAALGLVIDSVCSFLRSGGICAHTTLNHASGMPRGALFPIPATLGADSRRVRVSDPDLRIGEIVFQVIGDAAYVK